MKKVLRQALVTVLLFSILVLPAAWQSEAAATTTLTDGSYYAIQNLASGKFIKVSYGNITAGTTLQVGTYDLSTYMRQFFRLSAPEPGISSSYHKLVPYLNSSLTVSVDNASTAVGTNIELAEGSPGFGAQSFRFIDNGDGTFCIQPHLSSFRVLGVSVTTVQLVSYNANSVPNSQKWVLKKVNPTVDSTYYSMNWSYFFRDSNADTCIRVSQRFSNSSETSHHGLDIVGISGTNVLGKAIYSPCGGTVIQRGYEDTMGYFVIIETEDTDSNGKPLTIRLMHMQSSPNVDPDEQVSMNTLLGYVGNTGTSSGAHLHVDINNGGHTSGSKIRKDLNSAIDPEAFYPQIQFVYGLSASNVKYAT